jgi:hypothetical protein
MKNGENHEKTTYQCKYIIVSVPLNGGMLPEGGDWSGGWARPVTARQDLSYVDTRG